MDPLPDHPTPQSTPQSAPQPAQQRQVRVIRISVRPTTWFGRLAAGIIGVSVMVAAFFVSLVIFAIVASIVAVALVYFLWATRHARRAMRDRTIDGEVKGRAVH